MKKHKISTWLGVVIARGSYLISSVSDWKSLINLKRTITLSLLVFFAFNLSAPSALAYYELKKAYAADFGGVVSGAVSTIFGKAGDVLEQFDQKGKANDYKNLAASQTTFDLVAVLVDEDIANNTQEYDGLRSLHNPTVPADPAQAYRKLEAKTLIDRVERYAEDVQGINKVKNPEPFVKTVVIKVKKTDSTLDISSALQKLYREGDGTIGEKNRLKGIVLVGDVPIPVVNKNGNRFVSIFPYTDFDDPYYIVDNETQDFIVNVANKNAAVEVWHGVIKAPVQGPEGNNLLAEYFDKNHLYKLGEPAYADFAKKIFYSDLVKEFQSIGVEGLPGYNSYLKYWEDISYVRFNKTWAQKLFSESSFGKPEGDGFDNDNDGKIDEDPSNGYDDDGDAEKGSPLFGLINRVDDDGDGKIDNDEEGVWGYCSAIPATGKKALENCKEAGKPYKTGDFYNVKAGSFYFVADGVNNNSEEDVLIDEGIDEDEGDAFIKVDNDRDGRVDEDTSRDNDADGDGKSDEDGPGDMNSDGCPGQCKVDEDQDSVDSDSDLYPDGYEKDYGKLSLTIGGLADLIDAASSGNIKASFDSLKQNTDREDFFDMPVISLSPPIGFGFSFPRIIPFPSADEWIDEGSKSDDDEDGKVDEDGTVDNDKDQDGTADEDPGDALGNDGKGSGDFMDQLPDIRTKDVIMNFMKNYDQLVEKFYADINVWTDFTGRYSHTYDGADGKKKTDLTAIPALISAKDEFTRIYLKQINDALEKRVDQYVQKLQYDINLAKGATLSGYVVLPDANGVFPPNQKIKFNDVQFINFGYRNDTFFAGIEGLMDILKTLGPAAIEPAKQSFLDSLAGPVTAATPIYINGKSIDSIDNIEQCSLYRGSVGLENSQMVIANTVYDQQSNQNTDPVPQMPKEWNSQSKDALIGVDGNDYHGLYWWWNNSADSPMVQWLAKQRTLNKAFAGCFSENSKFPDRCFPSLATRYIFSLGGTRKVTGVPSTAVSHQACFDMKEKSGYDAFALAANLYLKAIGEKQIQSEKKAQDTLKPNAAAAYKKPADIKLIDFANKAPEEYELLPGTYLPIPPALILAAQASPSLGSFTVNFGDVLKKYLGADRVDNNGNGVIDEAAEASTEFFAINPSDGQPNWYQVGEQLLQSKREDEAAAQGKDKPLKFGNEVIPGTKEVYIRVTPIPGKSISSLVYHKEPTADTFQAQTYELERDANGAFIEDASLTEKQKKTDGKYKVVTKTAPDGTTVKKETRFASNIPIDSPRYVSFRDSKGAYQKIVYPNAFAAGTTEEFKQQLKDLEAQLKAIDVNPLYAGSGPASIDNYLTDVVDVSLNNDVINTSEDMISVVSEKKMADALKWKSMDLDQKHQYAFSHYLGSGFNPFTSLTESAKGYEMLYLVANGQADGLSMTFNKDIPPAKTEPKKDTVDCNMPENAKKAACKDIVPESDGPLPEVPLGQEADMESVIIFEWFVRLGEWAKETTDIINGKGAVTSCPAGSFADYVDSTNAEALAYQPTIPIPVDLNGDGVADAVNETVKLNLKLENQEKNVLRAGSNDQTKLVVEALTSSNKLNAADSFNEVMLVVKGNENGLVKIVGNDTTTLAGGKAEFSLQAGQTGGTVTVDAVLVKDSKVKSNSLAIVVSKKQIKLISYRRYKTYKFVEGPAAGYQIYDGNGNLIADVNPKTGYIKLLSNEYLLKVLPAIGSKPVRLAVVNKSTDQVVALLYFILSGEQKINIDAPAEDYFKNYEKLSGVHLKDISANDAYSLKTNSEEGPLKDFVTIVKDGLQVGLVDKVGGIYLSEELKIAQKLSPSGDGAVVLEIQDSSGKALFEAFLGAKFETITNVEWEKVKDLLAFLKSKLWKLAFLRTAHAADLATGEAGEDTAAKNKFTILDTDKDGLSDLEELIIGTKIDQADSNGDGINDLDSLNKGLSPLIKDKELFIDVKVGQEGFAEIIKLFRRGLIVADQNGKIRPKDSITREEFIKLDLGGICIICDRFAEKTKSSVWSLYSQSPFPDLDINEQYKYCVAEGKNRGIISGYKAFENAGYYVPKASISRAEATKVILETARQQIESFPEFINEEPTNKPWYYNYVLTAQKEGLYPKGKFLEIDQYTQGEFKKYFNEEVAKVAGLPGGIANSQFLLWLSQPISRVEFAIMVSKFTDKYNCLKIDSDGDSIPDNLEKYIYGTNPFDVDTDKGGVHDDVEILRGSNPQDGKDDFPVVPEDLDADPDGDGLNTGKEKEIGSNPNDPDTDKGGVHDGTEVIRGTDPLDQGDDANNTSQYNELNGIDGQEGAYLAGIEIKNATIYTVPEDGSVDQSQINTEETDRIPADGESVLYIKASIYDENGKVRADDMTSIVNFGFLDNKDYQHASLNPLKVKVKNGVAETVLTAKTVAGLPTVIASIDGENVPSDEKLIEVHALEPAKAELKIVSPIIPSGGLSSSVIKGILRDKYGNLANAGNYTASFKVNLKNEAGKAALAKIDDKNDEDKQADGVQVSSVTGEFDSKLISGANPEDLEVNFSYQSNATISENNSNNATADLLNLEASVFKPAEVSATKSLATRDDLNLMVTVDKTELKIGGKEKSKLTIKLEDKIGNVLTDFEGDVTLKILSNKIADLVEGDQKTKTISKNLQSGKAEFTLAGTLKAGEIVAIASVNGVKPTTLTMESFADKANQINLNILDKEIAADPNQVYTINAKLFDFAGNQVDRDNSSMVEFSIDPETAKFATIVGEKTKKVVNGQTDVTIKTGTLTGPIRIRAKSAGMTDGSIELYAKTEFKGRDFRDIKPKVLFASMLGSNFGQVTDENYLAGWFVFSGKVQSAVSLIAEPKPKVHLAEISSTGKVSTSENADMEIVIKSTTSDELPIRQIVTDLQENKDVMEIIAVLKPQTIIKQIQNIDEIEKLSDVIYVMMSDAESEIYQINNDGEKAQLTKSGDLIVEIEKTGKIRLYSPTIELVKTENDFGSLINLTVLDQGNEIAQVVVSPGDLGDVKILDSSFKFSGELASGIYLRQLSSIADRKFVTAFSGNSSKQSKGAYYVDEKQELGGDQAPGLGYDSLEKGGDVDGIGFKGDNKHMLLMAAGSSVGEANLPFASDAGVVIGDPTIKLNNQKDPTTGDKLFGSTGFTKDIGKMLYAGVTNIKDIATVDFDNDSDKDILIAYQNGKIRLLENMNRGKGFVDRGDLIDLANGLLSLAVGDINNDGWEDLVVASADSCKVGEVCVDAFLNNKGNFVRKNLNLEGFSAKNKVYVVKIADMNQDSYPDLITSDDTGTIKVFYTKEGQLNRKPSVIGSLGTKISQSDNLKEEVFVNYNGMVGNAPGNADDRFFQKILVKGEDASKDKNLEFKSLSNDAVIGVTSTKKVTDQTDPKDVLAEQDELLYTIKLTNSANVAVNNLLVADIVSSVTTLDPASIKCLDCQKEIALISTGISLRPYVIAGIDLPAKATRTITYSTKVGTLPKVKIAVGQNLSSIYPVKDGYPDIMATPENNPTGRIVYYYSISKNSNSDEINYGEIVSPDPNAGATGAYKQPVNPKTGKPVGIDLKLFDEKGPDGLPVAVKHFMDYGTFPGMEDAGGTKDEGLPGVGGALDGIGDSLDAAADDLAAGIAALTCSGGCIPLPINYAFLAPGPINVMGIPSGFDPGLPVFAAGIPSIIPVWPPSPYQASVFRLYVMPTLTGKMATSMCMGTYLVGFGPVPGNCFTIVLPMDIYAGLCDLISGAIEGAVGSANEFNSDGSGTIGMSDDGSLANTPTADGSNYTGGFSAATSLGNYGIKAGVSTNVRIPGFPSVITDWLDNQSSEIINKLTDLPDIYILLPDLLSPFKSGTKNSASQGADNLTLGDKNVKKEPVSPKGLRGVLNEINKIPMISIVPQEVLIKIPSLTPAEIDRFINDSKQWVQDEKAEVQRVMSLWKCGPFKEMVPDPQGGVGADGKPKMVPGYIDTDGSTVYGDRPYSKLCDILTVDMTDLIQSVEKNIEIIEGYKKLPRQILAWRNMLTKYVIQVICYIDAILNFFVGNIGKWINQANAWVDAVAKLIETIATWKLMFDLVIDYQTSCDKCTTSRFSLLELILKLFAFIPSPPVIPFPKLPDIYLDFSQIQLGVTILFPDIKFRPERIILPKLPRIVLPDLPTINIELPSIPLLPDLSLALPELPDLPPLTLPQLPNLPPPPKIPELPGAIKAVISILKKIFLILCLIKKGFIPTQEAVLKTTVEHMTERGLDPLLPFDLGLALQFPEISYEYVDRIVLSVKINLNNAIDLNFIYDFVQTAADKLNSVSTTFVQGLNELSKSAEVIMSNQADSINSGIDSAVPDGNKSDKALLNYVVPGLGEMSDQELTAQLAAISPYLSDTVNQLKLASVDLQKEADHYSEMIKKDYQDIRLAVTNITLSKDDPILNKSIDDLENFDLNKTMLALGNDFGETKKLAGLRQNLLAYVKENDRINQSLLGNDLGKAATMLAAAPSIGDTLRKSGFDGGTMLAEVPTLYAQLPSINDIVKNSGLPASLQNKQALKGMYIYNEALKQNEKLIEYNDEVALPTTMNFADTNNDGDKDLIYSYGSNVYLKENYKSAGSLGQFYGGIPKFIDLQELVPAQPAISAFSAQFNGNRTIDLKWNKANDKELAGYEVIVGKRLNGLGVDAGIESLKAAGLAKYVFLNTAENAGAALTDSILQPENSFNFPVSKLYELAADQVNGDVTFDGSRQQVMVIGEKLKITGGMEIFASEDAVLKVRDQGKDKADKKMVKRELIRMPENFGGDLEIELVSGAVTVIDQKTSEENQKLLPGSKINLDTEYKSVNGGTAIIKLSGETYTRVDADQILKIKTLENPNQPTASLEMENGSYYSIVRSFDKIGFRSTRSDIALLSPNICADRQDPLPVTGPAERSVAIFKTLQIDAAKSFDPFGKIESFYMDTNLDFDSDNDGDKTNDKNLGRDLDLETDSDGDGINNNDLNDSTFYLGPYKDLSDRKVMLNLLDQSGNLGQQEITIKVYVPEVYLDESSANLEILQSGDGAKVSGYINKPEDQIPVSIIRDRAGVKEVIKTKTGGQNGKYLTDNQGKFEINDLQLKDSIVIKNSAGEIVAEIDPKTGRIILKNPLYSVEALPAEEPLLPTRVVVKDPNGKVIATMFVVSDANTDVVIDSAELPYNAGTVAIFKGVHIKNMLGNGSGLSMKSIPADAEKYAGGVEIVEDSSLKRVALLDAGGNFYIYDQRLKINLQSAQDLSEPMIFVANWNAADNGQVEIANFHISYNAKNPITILDANQFKLFTGDGSGKGPKFDTDKDGIPDLWEQQYGLNIDDATDAQEDADQDKLTNLDEYLAGTNPLLADSDNDGYSDGFEKTFGKDPNTKATSPFVDVKPDNQYFQSILNFWQRGILDGIPAGNNLKFGFEQPINRAEYAKVILDTFCIVPRPEAYLEPGVFTDIPFVEGRVPWYFAATKEAYFQGFITGYKGLIDKVTGRTPFAPEATITKAEAVKIILEALERQGLINLGEIAVTEPYYLPYMSIAQDLSKVVKPGIKLKANFILTSDEAKDPDKAMVRGEFIKLADRVLTAYDCSQIDSDGDGMPDFWEKLNGLNPLDPKDADQDTDGDRLRNLNEYKYGTDPNLADTDKGGIGDGEEVLDRQTNPLDGKDDFRDSDGDGLSDQDEINKYGTKPGVKDSDGGGVSDGEEVLKNATNPLNSLDDFDTDKDGLGDKEEQSIYKTEYLNPDTDGGGVQDGTEVNRGTNPLEKSDDLIDPRKDLEPGVYVIQEACSICPCSSAIDHSADLIPGDKIIGVISNQASTEIFSQSNLVEIADVKAKDE